MLHEWIGVAVLAAILTHLLLGFDWFAAVTRRFFQKQTWQVRLNWILGLALFIAMTAAFYSGLVISKVVMPALGIELADGMSWKGIHAIASDFTLFLVGLHLAVNWKWVVRHILGPFRRQPRQAAENPATALPIRQARDGMKSAIKTIGRILIILAAAAIVIATLSALTSSTGDASAMQRPPAFDPSMVGDMPARPDHHEEGASALGLLELVKNSA